MARTRARMVRLRAIAAFLFAIAYVIGTVWFLLLLADPDLLGARRPGGVELAGWFVLLMIVGLAAIWTYPYERPGRRHRLTLVFARRADRGVTAGSPRT